MQEKQLDIIARKKLKNQVNELRQLESVLSRAFEKDDLLIVGAVYNLGSGKVEFLKEPWKIYLQPTMPKTTLQENKKSR